VFKQELQYARGVRDGRITDQVRMLPILYEFPEAMQVAPDKPWMNPANWPMVLPNLGRSITVERLIADFAEAPRRATRRSAAGRPSTSTSRSAWPARRPLARRRLLGTAADATLVSLEALIARCDVAVAGGRRRRPRRPLRPGRAGPRPGPASGCCGSGPGPRPTCSSRRKDIAERLNDFVAAGDLVVCTTPTQDIEEAADIIEQLLEAGLLPEKNAVGLDPPASPPWSTSSPAAASTRGRWWRCRRATASPARSGARAQAEGRHLAHAGQGLMAWCVGNAKAEQRGNAVLITKETAGKAKIDPLMAPSTPSADGAQPRVATPGDRRRHPGRGLRHRP
jgi:hypothetical protein